MTTDEYKQKLTTTLLEISDTITKTMGPTGKTCILFDGQGIPHVTKDGVTVSEFLTFKDPFKQAINLIVKETARKTGVEVGDGTTTSILLACSLILGMLKHSTATLSRIGEDIPLLIEYIKSNKVDLDMTDEKTVGILKSIITISSNNDKEIIDLLVDTIETIGVDGLVDVVVSQNNATTVDVRDGILLESTAHVLQTVELESTGIILVSGKVEKVHQLMSAMQIAQNSYNASPSMPIIVIADEFSLEVQNTILANNRQEKFKMYLVESDGFGLNNLDILDDMALLLECGIVSTDNNTPVTLQDITPKEVGIVDGAIIARSNTVLYKEGMMTEEVLDIRDGIIQKINDIKRVGEEKVGEIRHLEKRLTKFSKSATIKVGGLTDVEKMEKKDRVDDAVSAMYAAIRGGVVPGGGYMLYKAGKELNGQIHSVIKNLTAVPAATLTKLNFKLVFDDEKVINYRTTEVGDPFVLGILDPADVQIKALEQAYAITKTILGSSTILIPEEEDGKTQG